MSDLAVREEPYDGPVAQQLIAAIQLEYVDRYGGEDATPVEPGEFAPPHGRFYVGYLAGEAIASGGLRFIAADAVEIKRMYVAPAFRRRGFARELLQLLEDAARQLGATRVLLETGTQQPEAIALYESSGYERVEGFGHYAPVSVGFGKDLR